MTNHQCATALMSYDLHFTVQEYLRIILMSIEIICMTFKLDMINNQTVIINNFYTVGAYELYPLKY
jgi:hypothetical protein